MLIQFSASHSEAGPRRATLPGGLAPLAQPEVPAGAHAEVVVEEPDDGRARRSGRAASSRSGELRAARCGRGRRCSRAPSRRRGRCRPSWACRPWPRAGARSARRRGSAGRSPGARRIRIRTGVPRRVTGNATPGRDEERDHDAAPRRGRPRRLEADRPAGLDEHRVAGSHVPGDERDGPAGVGVPRAPRRRPRRRGGEGGAPVADRHDQRRSRPRPRATRARRARRARSRRARASRRAPRPAGPGPRAGPARERGGGGRRARRCTRR